MLTSKKQRMIMIEPNWKKKNKKLQYKINRLRRQVRGLVKRLERAEAVVDQVLASGDGNGAITANMEACLMAERYRIDHPKEGYGK